MVVEMGRRDQPAVGSIERLAGAESAPPRTALVLSAGGLFGAYQAGAWKALASEIQPDIVVGASVGSLNGWAIAGGCAPAELEARWLDFESAARLRFRFPRSLRDGLLDGRALEDRIREIYSAFTPRTRFAAVLTQVRPLRPRIFLDREVTWEHLAASCAVLGFLPQRRIGAATYSDGGLLNALPLWAAAELGATRIVAVNAMPVMPSATVRVLVAALRGLSRFRPRVPPRERVVLIAPKVAPGRAADLMRWDRANIERWIGEGARDADERKHSIRQCFGRE